MEVEVESVDNRSIVRIRDKVTAEYCESLQTRLDQVLEGGAEEVVVDLEKVPFMDSSGVEQIMRLYRLLQKREGRMIVRRPSPRVSQLFQLFRLDEFFTIQQK